MKIKMLKKIGLISILTLNFYGFSQTMNEISKIEKNYQNCLDKGNGMMNCALNYQTKSDSLLNVAYKNLKGKLNLTEQNNLKIEQRKWLQKRDAYFKKSLVEAKEENGGESRGEDFKMIYLDKQGEFVFKRIKELIRLRTKIK